MSNNIKGVRNNESSFKNEQFVHMPCPVCGFSTCCLFNLEAVKFLKLVAPSEPDYKKSISSFMCPRHHGPVGIAYSQQETKSA